MVTNKINGKQYVGVTNNISNRKASHKYEALTRNKKYPFYAAIRKYGFENFKFTIIEGGLTMEDAFKKEVHYIEVYNTLKKGYNACAGGHIPPIKKGKDNYWYGKPFPKERKEYLSRLFKGKKLTQEHKDNISKSQKGRKYSNEAKINFSIAKKRCWEEGIYSKPGYIEKLGKHRIGQKSKNSTIFCEQNGKTYLSIKDACKELGLHSTNVARHLRGEHKHVKGYTFKLIERYKLKNTV